MSLKNKICLITGGSSGIGKATCELVTSLGAKVTIGDLDATKGTSLAEELNSRHGDGTAIFCTCDVTDLESFRGCFLKTKETFGKIDMLHNNAGIWNDSPEMWSKQVDINLKGVVNGCLLAMEFMGTQKGGAGGHVISMSSQLGVTASPIMPVYSATKAGVLMLTRCLGSDFHLALNGIKYSCVCPNATSTNLFVEAEKHFLVPGPEMPQLFGQLASGVGGFQGPEVVARCVVKILEEGENGSAWLVAFGEEPKPIRIEDVPLSLSTPEPSFTAAV